MKKIFLLMIAALSGCATDVPLPIRSAPPAHIPLAVAVQEPDKQLGAAVRWGGVIAVVENRRDESFIEIVDQPLTKGGYPQESDKSTGRFLARVKGFVDPTIFAARRRITVTGTLDGVTERSIGEHPYRYPVLSVDHLYLWPSPPKTVHYPHPFSYHPWYPWGYGYPYPHRHY